MSRVTVKELHMLLDCFNSNAFSVYFGTAKGADRVEEIEEYCAQAIESNRVLFPGEDDLKLIADYEEGRLTASHVWNALFQDNGETHGTVFAKCFRSEVLEVRKLGSILLQQLAELQETESLIFDS